MKKIILLAILIIALFAVKCSNKKANADKSEINNKVALQVLHFPESGEDTLKASYFADTVIYVPLETTKESFVDNFKQVWMNDSFILICCYRAGLLLFQQDGKFVRRIGKIGRGPGKYISILHFDVIRDTIYISSTGRRSLLRYTFAGIFCDEVKLKYAPVYFNNTVDQKLACYFREEGKVLVYNKSFYSPDTIVVEYGVTNGRYRYMFGDLNFMTHFQKTPSGLLFNSYRSDTIWNITGNKKEPAFILDMKDKLLPYDTQFEFCKGDFDGWDKIAKAYQVVHFIPFSSWMFVFQKHWTDTEHDAIYLNNTKTGEIKKFNTSFIYDDIVGKQKLLTASLFYSADNLFTYYSVPSKMLKFLKQNSNCVSYGNNLSFISRIKRGKLKNLISPVFVLLR